MLDSATDDGAPDGGIPDGGIPDGGAPNGGAPNSGAPNGGAPNSGAPNSGAPDGGAPDGGAPDGGASDGGASDGGAPDGGIPDGGVPDGGVLVELQAVEFHYRERPALRGVDLQVRKGTIVGLAGPNGSGKTTLLKLVAGLIRPRSGSVRVLGLDPWHDRTRVMQRARFAFAPPPLYDSLTAREHLVALSRLGGGRVTDSEVDGALDLVGLSGRGRDRVATYSFGMRQRLVLAQALLPEPELLVLDEPADGLDPRAVLELRAILSRLRDERGVTVLLCSHMLVELEHLVDELLVLEQGSVLFNGTPDALRAGGERTRLRVNGDGPRAAEILRARGFSVQDVDGSLLDLPVDSLDLEHAQGLLAAEGLTLVEYGLHRPSLEAALLKRLGSGREAGL